MSKQNTLKPIVPPSIINSSNSLNPPNPPYVEVILSTWSKDSHGLYDYETEDQNYKIQKSYFRNNFKVYHDAVRNEMVLKTQLQIVSQSIVDHESSLVLSLAFERSKKVIRLMPTLRSSFNPYYTPYYVVRDFGQAQQAGYPLKPGHVIKLGRVEYMVIQAKNEEEVFTLRDTSHLEDNTPTFEVIENNEPKLNACKVHMDQCRYNDCQSKVCLRNDETKDDPLISPCWCKGSCLYIHVGCLQLWINSKVKKDIKSIATSYNFTKFQCEICKAPLPKVVKVDGVHLKMMTISKPQKPYIILESLQNKTELKTESCLHVIACSENSQLKIGRGHECEIRISDISVSRKHAEIKLIEGQFFIEDTKAKFGTLVRLEEHIVLNSAKPIKIQCGRTVITFILHTSVQEVDTE